MMSPDELRGHLADKGALPEARRALNLVGTPVRTDFFGRVEGIDTVHLALDALAQPLARLFAFPPDPSEAPRIEEVLDFMVSLDLIDEEVSEQLRQVRAGIKAWTYAGLPEDGEVYDLEQARSRLYDCLDSLLADVEEVPDEDDDDDG